MYTRELCARVNFKGIGNDMITNFFLGAVLATATTLITISIWEVCMRRLGVLSMRFPIGLTRHFIG